MDESRRSASAVDACRALAAQARSGALATTGIGAIEGMPFATLVLVAWDAHLRPLLLLSSLAEHTKNLEAHPQASILVHDGAPDVTGARMTMVGTCAPVPDPELDEARRLFLAAHPSAAQYAGFADFRVYRLEPKIVRWVGGFGRMTWVDVDALGPIGPR